MRKVTILLTIIFSMVLSTSFAQGKYGKDSAECIKYLSFYKDHLKAKDMATAAPLWSQAFKLCPPQASQNMIIDGQKIMKYRIANEKDAAVKKSLVDTLMMLHDLRTQYYPAYKLYSFANKALDMNKFTTDAMATNEAFKQALEIARGKKLVAKGLAVMYLNSSIDLFKDGKIEAEQVMKDYEMIIGVCESIKAKKPTEAIAAEIQAVEQLFAASGVASCENIVAMFEPKFQANPTDKALVSGIVKLMSEAQCVDSDLFVNALDALHQMEPSVTTAYYLYRLNASRGNHDLAVSFLEDAINQEDGDLERDAEYYMELATYNFKFMKNNVKAINYAKKAMELDDKLAGNANFLIGTIWASVKCSGNEIEQRAKFWVAVDYMYRAKKADPSLTEEVDRNIAQYSNYYPLAEDAFMYDLTSGQSYSISCGGLSATTTVRTISK